MKKDKLLFCKNCGAERQAGRRLCRKCNLARLTQVVKSKPRYTFKKVCLACNEEYPAWRKQQKLCRKCWKESLTLSSDKEDYVRLNKPGTTEHRVLAQSVLGRILDPNEVVHHMDDNPKNNNLSNLLVLSRYQHGKLHSYLRLQRVIVEKSMNENFENCWDSLIIPMTTAWLEMTSAKVIKLWEIGQSAAEPLSVNTYEEGSETMHEASDCLTVKDEDIVQTTTA